MRNVTLYLGSDHVIQQPEFPVNERQICLYRNAKDAVHEACKISATSVLNSYTIDMDMVSDADVICTHNKFTILADDGLNALCFASASFAQE